MNNKFLPFFIGLLYAFLLLVLWYFISLTIQNKVLPASFGSLKNFIFSLIGAFSGAFFAFKLSAYKDNKKLSDEHISILRKTMFILFRKINAVAVMMSRFEQKHHESEIERAFNLTAFCPPSYENLEFDYGGLSFLLLSHPNLLMLLSIEEERFKQVLFATKLRNDFFVNELQVVFDKKGLTDVNMDLDTLKKELGDRLYFSAINYANSMLELIVSSNDSLSKVQEQLINFSKELYPNELFLVLVKDEDADKET